ncbi:hypothetical protein ACX818_001330 [Acinetobacter baumannii]
MSLDFNDEAFENEYESWCHNQGWITSYDDDEYDSNWLWDDDYPELSAEDYERLEREYQEMAEDEPWNYHLDCTNIHSGKLEEFIKDSNSYSKLDKRFVHPDVLRRIQWYDPIHNYCNNHGYKICMNHIERLIAKHAPGGVAVSKLVYLIKNNIKYKKSNTFRSAAEHYISELTAKTWDSTWSGLYDFEVVNGVLWRKDEMYNYLGFGYTTFRRWCNGRTSIEYQKIEEMK